MKFLLIGIDDYEKALSGLKGFFNFIYCLIFKGSNKEFYTYNPILINRCLKKTMTELLPVHGSIIKTAFIFTGAFREIFLVFKPLKKV